MAILKILDSSCKFYLLESTYNKKGLYQGSCAL